LRPELLCGCAFQQLRRLRIDAVWTGDKAETFSKLVLGQLLHPDDDPAAGTFAARPGIDEMVNLPPSSQVEIADAEIRSVRELERVRQRGKQ